MPRSILILIGDPNFNYQDENSAVLKFLSQIKTAFQDDSNNVDFALGASFVPSDSIQTNVSKIKKNQAAVLKNILKKWNWMYHSISMVKYFRAQKKLFQKIQNYKRYDLIIEYHILGSTMGVRLKQEWNCRLNVIFDSPSPEQFLSFNGTKSIFWRRIKRAEQLTMEAAERIMAYSPATKEYLESNYSTSEINILPSLIHKKTAIKLKGSITFDIGFIGSFLPWHNLELLVKVFSEFAQVHPDSRLLLIGFGSEWNKVKSLVEELGVEAKVEMPGFVSESELADYKSMFTIAVMPGSNWYGSPLKLFEYAQIGLPFIAPSSKTVLSIFENEKHCLYVEEQGEYDSLYLALNRLYGNEELRLVLGKNVKEYVESEFNEATYNDKVHTYLS